MDRSLSWNFSESELLSQNSLGLATFPERQNQIPQSPQHSSSDDLIMDDMSTLVDPSSPIQDDVPMISRIPSNRYRIQQDDWFSSMSTLSRTASGATEASYHTAQFQGSSPPESPQSSSPVSLAPSPVPFASSRTHIQRDPYSKLNRLQREIILTIRNAIEDSIPFPHRPGENPRLMGIPIDVVVHTLLVRHRGMQVEELE
ncbi:hypothetical protein AMATHDRAFT_44815 [Amanita thiersii Skay4041]|uniref:Uncharacterized protein n=1 Tax=Amanita thiersii Skay4041 TaxID=703135 RepID=A0A2A9P148_9AGAR|nr:hypothetical protein AMATHDRAFT_44815 [Amanita thiersii Skay4041]